MSLFGKHTICDLQDLETTLKRFHPPFDAMSGIGHHHWYRSFGDPGYLYRNHALPAMVQIGFENPLSEFRFPWQVGDSKLWQPRMLWFTDYALKCAVA